MSASVSVAVFALLLSGLAGWAPAAEPMPPGIGIRMTIVGPAFVDARGMTLYQRSGTYICSDRPETIRPLAEVGYNQVEEFPMKVPDAASRRSCTQKYPPLLASAGAEPVGRWTLYQRNDGTLQWAYRGNPLHHSIKDRAPGDLHGWAPPDKEIQQTGWSIAAAPLAAPSGIETRLTSLGLVLANHAGMPLYHAGTGSEEAHDRNFKPVLVPESATPDRLPPEWSIASHPGGLRQWAWKGKPLYTYALDAGDNKPSDESPSRFVAVFGEVYGHPTAGWQAAVLKPPSAPPAGVRVKSIHPQYGRTNKIYADAQGKTLYAIHCAEFTRDRLDCDDVGDSPRYWLTFCGGEERCRSGWKPLAAPKQAQPIDGLWSVSVINPVHPFKPLQAGEQGLSVWTYRGRPVFTFAEDRRPDDTYGEFDFYSTVMTALPIYAFTTPE